MITGIGEPKTTAASAPPAIKTLPVLSRVAVGALRLLTMFGAGLWFVVYGSPRELTLQGTVETDTIHVGSKIGGRVRDVLNGPRTLDLDIVLYGESAHHEDGLTLPHPRAHERAFVLAPLLEVWPDAIIPGLGAASQYRERVAGQAIERLPDTP